MSVTIDGELYDKGEVYVNFDALGSTNNHTVVLYQRLFDRSFTVEVLGLTGLIKFHDGVFEREPAEEPDFD